MKNVWTLIEFYWSNIIKVFICISGDIMPSPINPEWSLYFRFVRIYFYPYTDVASLLHDTKNFSALWDIIDYFIWLKFIFPYCFHHYLPSAGTIPGGLLGLQFGIKSSSRLKNPYEHIEIYVAEFFRFGDCNLPGLMDGLSIESHIVKIQSIKFDLQPVGAGLVSGQVHPQIFFTGDIFTASGNYCELVAA